MITLLQRVSEASVTVAGECIAIIEKGLLILIGVQASDTEEIAGKFVTRLLNYRVFSDSDGKMNLSLLDIQGDLLLLTRRQYMSYSGLQESVRSRRGLKPMVVPLAKVATPSWRFLEAPNRLKIKKKGHRVPTHGRRYRNLQ